MIRNLSFWRRNPRKKILSGILVFILLTSHNYITYANEEELTLYAQSAVLMDGESGRILYSKEGELAHANASTTKILTCILALEYGDMEEIVVASAEAAKQPAVHLDVIEGEEYYLLDMLYALMLESYNDCAVIIAESISGSVEEFAKLMNEKAVEIGCEDSYFITPNGLDAEDEVGFHHTTASDLALIMQYCMLESPMKEEYLAITQTLTYSFQSVDGSRYVSCYNHNTLLQTNENAITGKTGFTNDAGYCYVGAIESEGRTFIVVLLGCGWPYNSTYKWTDCATLFNYGEENYFYTVFDSSDYTSDFEQEYLSHILVEGGKTLESVYTLDLVVEESEAVSILKRSEEMIEVKVDCVSRLYAPIEACTLVGSISYYLGDTLVKVDSILTTETVEEEPFGWNLYKKIFG